jgi:hypothetical protein
VCIPPDPAAAADVKAGAFFFKPRKCRNLVATAGSGAAAGSIAYIYPFKSFSSFVVSSKIPSISLRKAGKWLQHMPI